MVTGFDDDRQLKAYHQQVRYQLIQRALGAAGYCVVKSPPWRRRIVRNSR
jgi:hypothetical protein